MNMSVQNCAKLNFFEKRRKLDTKQGKNKKDIKNIK